MSDIQQDIETLRAECGHAEQDGDDQIALDVAEVIRILEHIDAQQKRIEELEHDGTLWAEANWKRVKELERERDELKAQLTAVESECAALRSQVAG